MGHAGLVLGWLQNQLLLYYLFRQRDWFCWSEYQQVAPQLSSTWHLRVMTPVITYILTTTIRHRPWLLIWHWNISVHAADFEWTGRRFHKRSRKLSSKLAWILCLSAKTMSCTSHGSINDRWTWPQTATMNRCLQSNYADELPIIFGRFRRQLLSNCILDLWAVLTKQTRSYGISSTVTGRTSGGSRYFFTYLNDNGKCPHHISRV